MVGERTTTVSFFGMRFNVMFSKCPTNTNVLGVAANVVTTQGEMTLEKFLAEGGSFGKSCYEQLKKSDYVYYTSASQAQSSQETKDTPCLVDTDLTLEQIKANLEKVKQDR